MQVRHSKPFIDKEDVRVVSEQVKSGAHAYGSKAREFENEILNLIGQKYARAVSSGAIALHLALLALNIRKGDEVIIPSYVCQSVLHAVNQTGAIPKLADVGEDSFNISAEKIRLLISQRTKAIIVAHLFGIPADIEPIIELAKKHNIPVIEDCAQSLGAKYGDRTLTGSKGVISIFSFYATKIISSGLGGMILTSHPIINERIKQLTICDKTPSYNVAYSYNLSDIHASLGLSQLKKLDSFIKRRKEIGLKYDKVFKELGIKIFDYETGFPFRYILRLKDKGERDLVLGKLKEKGIDSELPVFKPLHRYLGLSDNDFKNTSEIQDSVLSIPLYPALSDEEVEYVVDGVGGVFEN